MKQCDRLIIGVHTDKLSRSTSVFLLKTKRLEEMRLCGDIGNVGVLCDMLHD